MATNVKPHVNGWEGMIVAAVADKPVWRVEARGHLAGTTVMQEGVIWREQDVLTMDAEDFWKQGESEKFGIFHSIKIIRSFGSMETFVKKNECLSIEMKN